MNESAFTRPSYSSIQSSLDIVSLRVSMNPVRDTGSK